MRAKRVDERPIYVSIAFEGKEIVSVPQRELFSKNGWPAEATIKKSLENFKNDAE